MLWKFITYLYSIQIMHAKVCWTPLSLAIEIHSNILYSIILNMLKICYQWILWVRMSKSKSALQLRATSYYGRRLRGRWFSLVGLQGIKNSASRSFTLKAKVQGLLSYIAVLFYLSFDQSNGLSKGVWVELE